MIHPASLIDHFPSSADQGDSTLGFIWIHEHLVHLSHNSDRWQNTCMKGGCPTPILLLDLHFSFWFMRSQHPHEWSNYVTASGAAIEEDEDDE